jgi:tetratricopeptide (TPR) repeat protein
MEALKHAADQAKGGHGQIVAAMAEPGVGKSRLFFEFKATSAYLPVIDLLHSYFRMTNDDDERVRREKVGGKVLMLDRALEDTLPYLFSLLGIVEGNDPLAQMDGQIRKRRTLEAIKRIVLRESLNQPLMVIFEDLHWIDAQTQEFLNLLADSLGTAKILLLVNYRPEYSHKWNSKTYYTQLRLDPLGQESAAEMLSALLGDSKDLAPLKRLIIERTGANPFFMEEIVQTLFEDDVLQRNGTVKLAKSMNAVKVPATVQAILTSRIDRLSAEEKELLQTLAVLGREFALSLVRRVVDGATDDDLNRMLANLQMAEFIYEQPATGDIEYIFKHALTQEVAYNSLLIERRKQLHERAGQAMESMFAGQLEDHPDELAHHYGRSDNVEKAVEYLIRAGDHAASRSAYSEAVHQFEAALGHLDKLPASAAHDQQEVTVRARFTPLLGAHYGNGSREVWLNVTRAHELCRRIGDTPALVPVLVGMHTAHWIAGRHFDARDVATQLLSVAGRSQDDVAQAFGHTAMGLSCAWMGDYVQAREHLETTLALAAGKQSFGSLEESFYSLCLQHLSWTMWMLGYPEQAMHRMTQMLEIADRIGRSFEKVSALQAEIALRSHFLREYSSVRAKSQALIVMSQEGGLRYWRACGMVRLGRIEVGIGNADEGIRLTQEGIALLDPAEDGMTCRYFRCVFADAYLAAGIAPEGLAVIEEELPIAEASGQRFNLAELFRLKGELLLLQGQPDRAEAERCLRKSVEIAQGQQARSWEVRATTSLARLLNKQGNRDEARAMLADIYGWFTEGFDTADLIDAKALLDQLST